MVRCLKSRRYRPNVCSLNFLSETSLESDLVLKNFLKTDYRGLVEYLADCDSFAGLIELNCIPHYTKFQKAVKRLLVNKSAQRILDSTELDITPFQHPAVYISAGTFCTNAAVDSKDQPRGLPKKPSTRWFGSPMDYHRSRSTKHPCRQSTNRFGRQHQKSPLATT